MAAAGRRLVFLGSAALLLAARRLLAARTAQRRARFGGLEGLVSYSSRLIAAARAAESQRPDAFVVDPLASILAGAQAMAKYTQQQPSAAPAAASSSQEQPAQPAAAGADAAATTQPQQMQQAARPVPRLIMRTAFFDDAALAAVGSPAQRSAAVLAPLLEHMMLQQASPGCTQVVLLGSGMDSRPWRLALPPGRVRWFEVDRHDVLAAKCRELQQAGVQFSSSTSGPAGGTNSSSSSSSTQQVVPLKAASWACASADLCKRGWTQRLVAAGLDPQQPTAWLAEGLTYYLEPDSVGAMLQEAASVSAPGSVLAVNFLTQESLQLMHQRRQAGASTSPAAAGGTGSTPAAGSAGSSRGLQGLPSRFKWGCPGRPDEYFAAHGWQLLVCQGWTQVALGYGWQPQMPADSVPRPPSQEVQFAVGVVAPAAAAAS